MGFIEKLTTKKYQTETKPQMSELAAADYSLYGKSGKIVPYNPDTLIGRKGFYMYDQMRIDDQIKACLTLKKFATLAPSYQIIPASTDPEDIEIAEFVEYSFDKMQGNLTDSILEIMTALDYGYSITEINYRTFDQGVFKDKIGIKNLKSKRPHYYRFEVDKYSNLTKDGIIYEGQGQEKKYPINKFLIFSYQKEFGNHYGTSDLRPAYRGYWSKDVLIKMWNIYLERFANPTVLGKYKTNDPSARQNLRDILDNLTAKTSITHRMDEFDIDLLESGRNATGDFERALNFYNKSIARSILIPDRLMAEGDTGAYAQAKIHFDVFLFVIQKLRLDIEETVINQQLIRRLIAYNYNNVETLPMFKFNPMTDDQKLQLNTLFIDAVQKGVISPTLEDENILRKNLNFPEKDIDPTPDNANEIVTEEADEEELEEISENSFSQVDLRPTEAMQREGERALEWRKEFGRGGTEVGIARAAQLKNRENLSPDTVKRMKSFFARHEVDKKAKGFRPGEEGYPSNGRIAWSMWGGDAGQTWANNKVRQLENKPNADDQEVNVYSPRDKALKNKVEKHNEKYGNTKTKRTNLRALKAVYDRGIGAFRTNPGSVRPSVKSKEQWAMARVNSFLAALRTGRFRSGKHDQDLFPKGHPLSSKKNSQEYNYRPSGAERRVDFKNIQDELDNLETAFLDQTRDVMIRQKDAVVKYVENKMKQNALDFTAVDNLELKFKGELKKTFQTNYERSFNSGSKSANADLPKKFIKAEVGIGLKTQELQRYLQSKARFDVQEITQRLGASLTTVLMDAIRSGKSTSEIMIEIEKTFDPYTATGSGISATTGNVIESYTLRTITRTATLGSYNFGRRSRYEDADLKDFVLGYKLSPVLDERTTEICQLIARENIQIRIEDQENIARLTPPLHYNCRTIIVAITTLDEPIAFTDPSVLGQIKGLTKVV
jgi:phage gp29-like protein